MCKIGIVGFLLVALVLLSGCVPATTPPPASPPAPAPAVEGPHAPAAEAPVATGTGDSPQSPGTSPSRFEPCGRRSKSNHRRFLSHGSVRVGQSATTTSDRRWR